MPRKPESDLGPVERRPIHFLPEHLAWIDQERGATSRSGFLREVMIRDGAPSPLRALVSEIDPDVPRFPKPAIGGAQRVEVAGGEHRFGEPQKVGGKHGIAATLVRNCLNEECRMTDRKLARNPGRTGCPEVGV